VLVDLRVKFYKPVKKIFALVFTLFYFGAAFSQADDLMLVEYVDWASNSGVGIKIYNPTSSTINLSGYSLNIYNSASLSPTNSSSLSGTIAPGATKVFGNSTYCGSPANCNCDASFSSSGVTGNDAIALVKSGNYIDMIGLVGTSPSGYTVDGISNALLHRKAVRNANNCTRYTSITGSGTNSWPNSSSTNVTGWTMVSAACLTGGFSLNTSSGAPKINIPSKDTTVCEGTSVNFTADGSYKWWRKNGSGSSVVNSGATSISISFQQNGYDTIIVEGTSCGAPVYDTLVVKVGEPINFSFGPDSTFCGNLSFILNPSISGASYIWQDNTTTATYSVSTPGKYWAQATRDNCLAVDTIVIAFQAAAVPNLGIDTSICAGDSIIKTYTCAGCSYLWSTNETTPSITIKQTNSYWLEVSDGGCKTYDTINVTVNPLPTVSIGADTSVCAGDSVIKSSPCVGCTYVWNTNETTAAITIKTAGTYWLQVANAGCKNADTANVTVNSLPVVNLGADASICVGDSITESSPCAGCTYLWSTNETTPSINIKQSGSYWLQATSAGCKNFDTVVISQKPVPVFSLGPDVSLCPSTTAILRTNIAGTKIWSDNSTADTLAVSAAGTYWARITQNGCSYTDSSNVAVIAAPAKVLKDTSICQGQSLTLDATVSGASYTWDDNSTQNTRIVTAQGKYKVSLVLNGCTFADSATVTQGQLPLKPNLRDTTVCEDANLVLNATTLGANKYVWNTGETSPAITLDSVGLYIVTASNNCGSVSDTVLVTANNCDPPFIPNVFTPNNDGLNDGFYVDFKNARVFKIEIFNRWGEKVFESDNKTFVWKGDFRGQMVPAGVYFYVISSQTGIGNVFNTSGTLTLLR
jgi:gliding motility-associated-like protein